MKRKTKLLLLVVIAMSSILGTYLINGCGDKKATETKVTFSIKGFVTSANTNAPLEDAWVHYEKDTHLDSVKTDYRGRYVIAELTQSGCYRLYFTRADFAGLFHSVYGSVDSQTVDRNAWLYERNASVYGYLLASPAGSSVSKMDAGKAALDNPDPIGPAPAGTKVWLRIDSDCPYIHDNNYYYDDRCDDASLVIEPALYETTTNAAGRFRFDNIPAIEGDCIRLVTSQFSSADLDSCFASTETSLLLRYNDSVDAGYIKADLCGDAPVVQVISPDPSSRIPLDASITVTFSREMNPATVAFLLTEGCYYGASQTLSVSDNDLGFDTTWSNSYRTVVIKSATLFKPDDRICLEILSGKGTNGKTLTGIDSWYWNTVEGMRFVGTNLDDFGTECSNFPLDNTIEICFNMPPVLPVPSAHYLGDTIKFIDDLSRDIAFAASVSGNCLSINPTLALEQGRCYSITFTIYSTQSERKTYDQNIITSCEGSFCTEQVCDTLTKPLHVALTDTAFKADYNTTSLSFQWDKLPGAKTYQIYAKDTHTNTTWIKVADNIHPLDFVTFDGGNVNFNDPLNEKFDVYKTDEMITPFTDDNKISFRVRGVNCKGQEGPWSDEVLVEDRTAPDFCVAQSGDADNTNGTTTSDVAISISQDEYMMRPGTTNPTFSFVEAGGSADPLLTSAAVTWTWDNDMRSWEGVIKVPAGVGAAGDLLITKMKDNSGNEGTDTIVLGRIYNIWTKNHDGSDTNTVTLTKGTDPNSWEAGTGRAYWSTQELDCGSVVSPSCSTHFWVFRSYDGGTTWLDDSTSVTWGDYEGEDCNDHWYDFDVDDTLRVDNNAMLGFRRATGGIRWLSDKFTINGIKITKPDSLYAVDSAKAVFDRGGTDSTAFPLRWNSYGIDTVYVGYKVNGAGALLTTNTVAVTPGDQTFSWYPPSRGMDYNARLFVWKKDGDSRPWDSTIQMFNVKHDTILIDDPGMTSKSIVAGSPYEIKWKNLAPFGVFATGKDTALPSKVSIYYTAHMPISALSLDTLPESSWRLIVLDSANDGRQMWTPPDTVASNDCWLRIKDGNGRFYYSSHDSTKFAIGGLRVTSPNAFHQEFYVGTAPNITWDSTNGYTGTIDIYLDTIGYDTTTTPSQWMQLYTGTPNDGSQAWPTLGSADAPLKNYVPNWPNNHSRIKIKKNGGTIYDVSDSNFTIAGFIITDPILSSDTLFEDRIDTIDITTIGTIGTYDIFMSSVAGAFTDTVALASNNQPKFFWTVPNIYTTPRSDVQLIVRRSGGVTADTVSNLVLESPGITITSPTLDTVLWQENTPHAITWTSRGLRSGFVTIELSTTGSGGTWSYLTPVTGVTNNGSWTWTTLNLTGGDLTNCFIRITEVYTGQGTALSDVSDFSFTIDDLQL